MRWALVCGLVLGCDLQPPRHQTRSLDLGTVLVLPGRPVVLEREVLVTNEGELDRPLRFDVHPRDGALEVKLEGPATLRPGELRRAAVRVTLTAPGPKRWLLSIEGAPIAVSATGEAPGPCRARLRWAGQVFDSAVEVVNEGESDCFFGQPTARGDEHSLSVTPALSLPLKPGTSLVLRPRPARQVLDTPAAALVLPVLNDGSDRRLVLSPRCLSHTQVSFGRGLHTCARPPQEVVFSNLCDAPLEMVASATTSVFTVTGPLGVPLSLSLATPSARFTLSADPSVRGRSSGGLSLALKSGEVNWSWSAGFEFENEPRVNDTIGFRVPPAVRQDWLIAVAGGPALEPALTHFEETLWRRPGAPVDDLAIAVVSAGPTGGDFHSTDAGVRVVTSSSMRWKPDLGHLLRAPMTSSTSPSCVEAFLRALEPGRLAGPNVGLLRDGVPLNLICLTTQRDTTSLDAGTAFAELQAALGARAFSVSSIGPSGTCPQQQVASGVLEDLSRRTRGSVLGTCESVGQLAWVEYRKIFYLSSVVQDASWLTVELDGVVTAAVSANGTRSWQLDAQRNAIVFDEYPLGKTITVRVLQPCP